MQDPDVPKGKILCRVRQYSYPTDIDNAKP